MNDSLAYYGLPSFVLIKKDIGPLFKFYVI